MFLRDKTRKKDGKVHRYWSVVENHRVAGGRVVQRELLYLGEINDSQHAGWVRAIEAVECKGKPAQRLALFPEDRQGPENLSIPVVHVRLDELVLSRPRQWGGCWLALHLWDVVEFDRFWSDRLGVSRKGTRWLHVLKSLVVYRLLDPGSEWRFHREWFSSTAMADLLGEDFSLAQKDKPYRCLDRLLEHKDAMFDFLKERWSALFSATYDVLLYDLTSTYFESNPPPPGSTSKKRFGYSRDHRPDCVQVVIALIVTPEGLPLAYHVLDGNTRDSSTLEDFLDEIERRYGKARRTWLMDRGIPTEDTLEKMRSRDTAYIVGTPKGRLTQLEQSLLEQPWTKVRDTVRVKLVPHDDEFYVFVESNDRLAKERSMRQRRMRELIKTLRELRARKRLTRDQLLMGLGAAKKQAGRAWGLFTIHTPAASETVTTQTFTFTINRPALRKARRREGRYLLRSNATVQSPQQAWENYLLLVRIEQAFKDLKGDLSIRPIWHQKDERIEAHILVAFLAYCLHTTLRNLSRTQAGSGLTSNEILRRLSQIQMLDVDLPTTDGRHIHMSRHTQPSPETALAITILGLTLPEQPPPKITQLADTRSADFS